MSFSVALYNRTRMQVLHTIDLLTDALWVHSPPGISQDSQLQALHAEDRQSVHK